MTMINQWFGHLFAWDIDNSRFVVGCDQILEHVGDAKNDGLRVLHRVALNLRALWQVGKSFVNDNGNLYNRHSVIYG